MVKNVGLMKEAQQELLELEERVEARVQDIRASRDWWPCRRGCSQCCRQLAQPPELSVQEWERIDEAVVALPKHIRTEVEQKINHLLVQIAENTVSSQVVCPYLDENEGACRIYDARPIACRTYGFFVACNGNDYCEIIENEVSSRSHTTSDIVWGNAEAIRNEIEQVFGLTIPFDVHYSQAK